MTSRERVIAAIEFKGPDKLPHKHCYLPATVKKYPGLRKLLKQYPSDFAGEDITEDKQYAFQNPNQYRVGQRIDEWNCTLTVALDGYKGQVTKHPIEDLSSLKDYSWPEAAYADISWDISAAKNRGDRYVALGGINLFERMVDLRGFENLMIDIALGEQKLFTIRDHVLKYNLGVIDRLLELNPDCIKLGDDWGSQISLMINPSLWRELFLPAYQEMFERIHDADKHVLFHTDGYTMEILPDLVKIGADVFWVDLTVNPLPVLRDKFGGKVCFLGLTDVQFVMKDGTPTDVEKHAKELINALGTYHGGFIACSELDPDHPWDNIRTILEAFHNYGNYPIKIH